MRAKIMVALASVLFVGCAGYQVVPTAVAADQLLAAPPAGTAKVCILRPQPGALALTAVVHDDHQLVGATTSESYFCYLAQPGEHRIVAAADRQRNELLANPKPGAVLFLKQTVSSGDVTAPTQINWAEISAVDAQQIVAGLRYVTLASARNEALPDSAAVVPAIVPDTAQVATINTAQ